MRISGRQLSLTILAAALLLAAVFIFALFAFAPEVAGVYQPFLLTSFIVALFISLVAIAWLLRGILRPYNQLISEAERVPVARSGKTQMSALARNISGRRPQLQAQSRSWAPDRGSEPARDRPNFSARIVASMRRVDCLACRGKATVAKARRTCTVDGHTNLRRTFRISSRRARLADLVDPASAAVRFFVVKKSRQMPHRKRSDSAQP